jgi:hexosaminidase
MKKICIWLFALMVPAMLMAQQNSIAIVPQPVSVSPQQGHFSFNNNIFISAPTSADVQYVTDYLKNKLTKATGYPVTVSASGSNAAIQLMLNKSSDTTLKNEGYKLSVTPNGIVIRANKPAGLFYGVQTLMQLLPKEIESDTTVRNVSWTAPCVEITDYPRFAWRGLMFDVARHFFTKQDVKDFIDQMVKYKLNLLHMHLTDDEGWRIEIKSLPKLTEVGAWNVKKVGYFGGFSQPTPDEPRNYGGFYTQDDIKELVQYAKERFVNILPEIDVPGHSLAAIAAYPDLSCSGGVYNHGVSSGESIKDWSTHTQLVDDNLCPANENVYAFLDKVLTEVAQLFPFEYIHMGGDETFKTFWEKSDAVKALMKKENLKTMEEVQSYFSKRVEKIVESKGKKFMGWDEILEGGLAPDAAVMSWRGIQGGIEAAKQKHEVVMSPTTFAYLDYMQGDAIIEPHIYATLRLKKAYEFEPVPEGVDPKYIKGGQGNLWAEQLFNVRHMQYMLWPRAMAVAESVWSPKSAKDWNNFVDRIEAQFPRFDEANVKYAPSLYDPSFKADTTADGKLIITLTPEANNLDIYYSFDNSFPDRFYPKYTEPLIAPKDAVMLKVITYRGNQPIGRMISMPLDVLRKRIGKKEEE